MVQLEFYGGVAEIGGNKILLKEDNDSFFLDFGMSFTVAGKYFSEFLQPRKSNGIFDFVELGLLPCIKGIYREDYLGHSGIKAEEEPAVTGVLISHAHMDHMAYIHHLRGDIPLYLTGQSKLILQALEDTSTTSFGEYIHLKKSFQMKHRKNRKEGSSPYTRPQKSDRMERDIRLLKPYHPQEVGEVKIISVPVDHSLPGATAYFLETDTESLIYTGDLRFHGRNSRLTRKFVKKACKFSPTIIISEGTRIGRRGENLTEKFIEEKATHLVDNAQGHVLVNYPIRDLDRFLTFYQVARNTDRTLVVNLKQAYLLNLFQGEGYPPLSELAIYLPQRNYGLCKEDNYVCIEGNWICASEFDEEIASDYKVWERPFLELENTVNCDDIRYNPQEYIFTCDFFELKELIDIKPEQGIYLWSKTEPFTEEMEIDWRRVQNWMNHFHLELISRGLHGSGHARGEEILEMIREMNPDRVYPIHTEAPDEFNTLHGEGIKVLEPQLNI